MLSNFFMLLNRWISYIKKDKEVSNITIKNIDLKTNEKYNPNRPWGKRSLSYIDKIIVHQAMSDGTTKDIHTYHTSENSHLKSGGAPRIAYHYTIEKDGTIYKTNHLDDVVWHCRGQNIQSIGILVLGNFDGPSYQGASFPTENQLKSLRGLLDTLREDLKLTPNSIYGHRDFGKENCPGIMLMNELIKYKRTQYR